MSDIPITDKDFGLESRTPESCQASTHGARNSWKSLVLKNWPNGDGIMAWFLYQMGYEFLVSGNLDAVGEVVEILRPLDHNLAALLSSRVCY